LALNNKILRGIFNKQNAERLYNSCALLDRGALLEKHQMHHSKILVFLFVSEKLGYNNYKEKLKKAND
jgi:hypothetical protein